MRDLVGHSRSATAYLVYLQLYRQSIAIGRDTIMISHAMLADASGISKRAVQDAIVHLRERQLLKMSKTSPTAIPEYTVLTPWRRISVPRAN